MDSLLIKQNLTPQELQMVDSEFNKRKKSTGAAWVLWLFLGGIGGHRYYLGNTGMAIAMTLTLGGLGFWTLIDAFFIMGAIRKSNEKIELEIMERIHLLRNNAHRNEAAATLG